MQSTCTQKDSRRQSDSETSKVSRAKICPKENGSSLGVFLVRIFHALAKELGLAAKDQDCGLNTRDSLARYDHDSQSGLSEKLDRVKGLGNSIVPQIAEMIFRQIKEFV